MKKIVICIMAICLSFTFISLQTFASTNNTATLPVISKSAECNEANGLIQRLNEINAMDKSKLTFSDKNKLRREVRATSGHLREIGGGVYLSAGAIIIIILALIILF